MTYTGSICWNLFCSGSITPSTLFTYVRNSYYTASELSSGSWQSMFSVVFFFVSLLFFYFPCFFSCLMGGYKSTHTKKGLSVCGCSATSKPQKVIPGKRREAVLCVFFTLDRKLRHRDTNYSSSMLPRMQ